MLDIIKNTYLVMWKDYEYIIFVQVEHKPSKNSVNLYREIMKPIKTGFKEHSAYLKYKNPLYNGRCAY